MWNQNALPEGKKFEISAQNFHIALHDGHSLIQTFLDMSALYVSK
jgi:hypothetical protein